MANEGQFPKADGDVLYASEVNRFAGAGRYFGGGSTVVISSSGTAYQALGSVLIAAGSLTNPCELAISYATFRTGAGANFAAPRIVLSGASTNVTLSPLNTIGAGSVVSGHLRAVIGSPMTGFAHMQAHVHAGDEQTGSLGYSNFVVVNLNAAAALVAIFSAKIDQNTNFTGAWSVQGFRTTISGA